MKLKSTTIILLIATAVLIAPGCRKYPKLVGNGQVTTEERSLFSFNEVESSDVFNVYIKHDSVYTATVEAESNLIPYIRTIVNGNTLEIDTRENIESNYPINVYVTTPIIKKASLSGSGYMSIDSLNTEYLEIVLSGSGEISGYATASSLTTNISGSGNISLEAYTNSCNAGISGSGNINLVGETLSGSFTISGSGQINAFSFSQNECIAKISGSGNMNLNVIDFLDVTISGSGSIYYIGDPSINVSITGSGELIKQ